MHDADSIASYCHHTELPLSLVLMPFLHSACDNNYVVSYNFNNQMTHHQAYIQPKVTFNS